MTTPSPGIGAITLRTMRTKLDEAAAIARAEVDPHTPSSFLRRL